MSRTGQAIRTMLTPTAAWGAMFSGLALALIGILTISGSSEPAHAQQQFIWLGLALVATVLVMMIPPKAWGLIAYPLLIGTMLLLALLLLPGVPQAIVPIRNNARCWINLYFMHAQPSELAKIAFILALAWYLRFRKNYRTLSGLLVPFVIMFIPVILILKEPDLGSAMMFVPALFFMLVAAGAKLKHLIILVGLALAAVAFNIVIIYTLPDHLQILKSYQRQRIVDFIDREGDQQQTAMRLLGGGGLQGYGREQSALVLKYNYLPEDHNDMIFALIVNRWGWFGGMTVISLYATFLLSFLVVAARLKDPFSRLATVGFAGLIFCQAAINMAMPLSLLPITGITLPFVSYGGSSLLATFVMVGLVMNFAAHRPQILARPSFEYGHTNKK